MSIASSSTYGQCVSMLACSIHKLLNVFSFEPLMVQRLFNGNPLLRVLRQQLLKQFAGLHAQHPRILFEFTEIYLAIHDYLLQFFLLEGIEGQLTGQHLEKQDAEGPRVDLVVIPLALNHLWRQRGQRPNLSCRVLAVLDVFTIAKIRQFKHNLLLPFFVIIEQKVLDHDISMNQAISVTLLNCQKHLLKELFGLVLLETNELVLVIVYFEDAAQILRQLLHDDDEHVLRLEALDHIHYIRMIKLNHGLKLIPRRLYAT